MTSEPQPAANILSKRVSQPMGRGRVLVVDDEDMVLQVMSRFLGQMGFEVITRGDPLEALAWFTEQKGQVDLVILDLTMPEMSGPEVFRAMRNQNPTVPILLASGYTSSAEVPVLLGTGRAGFLGKPFQLDDLTEAVKALGLVKEKDQLETAQ